MNNDQSKGTLDKLKGDLKEGLGKLSNDESMEAEGKMDQAKGTVRKKFGDAKERLAGEFNDTVDKNK